MLLSRKKWNCRATRVMRRLWCNEDGGDLVTSILVVALSTIVLYAISQMIGVNSTGPTGSGVMGFAKGILAKFGVTW